jgi:hypothetical protein
MIPAFAVMRDINMRNVHSILVSVIVSVALSLPAVAGPVVSAAKPSSVQSAKSLIDARRAHAAGKNSEMDMIQLQSAMSQRQTAIQLTSSILQKTEESKRQMLSNCPSCFR